MLLLPRVPLLALPTLLLLLLPVFGCLRRDLRIEYLDDERYDPAGVKSDMYDKLDTFANIDVMDGSPINELLL